MEYLQYVLYFLVVMWLWMLVPMAVWHSWCHARWEYLGWRPLFYDEGHLKKVADAQADKLFDTPVWRERLRGRDCAEWEPFEKAVLDSHHAAIERYVKTFADFCLAPKDAERCPPSLPAPPAGVSPAPTSPLNPNRSRHGH